jgi:hypothetical protein
MGSAGPARAGSAGLGSDNVDGRPYWFRAVGVDAVSGGASAAGTASRPRVWRGWRSVRPRCSR